MTNTMLQRFISGGLCIWIITALLKTEHSRGNEVPLETELVEVECAESQETCAFNCTEIRPEESGILVRWSAVNSFGNNSQLVAAWDRSPANPPYLVDRFNISSSLSLIIHNVSTSDAGIFRCSVDRPNKDKTNCYNKLHVHDISTAAPTGRTGTAVLSALPSDHPTTEIPRKHYVIAAWEICLMVPVTVLAILKFILILRNLLTKASSQTCKDETVDIESALLMERLITYNENFHLEREAGESNDKDIGQGSRSGDGKDGSVTFSSSLLKLDKRGKY